MCGAAAARRCSVRDVAHRPSCRRGTRRACPIGNPVTRVRFIYSDTVRTGHRRQVDIRTSGRHDSPIPIPIRTQRSPRTSTVTRYGNRTLPTLQGLQHTFVCTPPTHTTNRTKDHAMSCTLSRSTRCIPAADSTTRHRHPSIPNNPPTQERCRLSMFTPLMTFMSACQHTSE